ncbi:dipeptidyl aminopeptidase/acylaminoacyl peptidase [Roseiarcus fermentans]|uniref:Dipeptidyl aminopeptidase/acylaminoacyl peptidase n=1 Tax=Roseiarcus fermentans TaxID=1473586 RepID=A0A366FSS1_9HYPH|nr:S9 family peptidase [Roseiarcus fermentans]RBP17617.1 dipeptidyl aminopeptidase/acylaminoacyl peptidase [Roseiarcus fermentans]
MATTPYGFWKSPITSDLVVADAVRFEQVALDGDGVYWSETQPQKQGRTFVYRAGGDGEPDRVTPDDANAFSVRTRVHEYGGGAFAVADGVVFFSNNKDQRLYRQAVGGPPTPITAAPTDGAADGLRYADGVVDRRRGRMVCVREDHSGAGEAIATLVAVDLSGATVPRVLVSGNDFYSSPRLNPDGNRLSWLTWRHPDMPWVSTEAWVGDVLPDGAIGQARKVAGGPNESVFQPEWSPDGDLYFVSDRGSGWWNLHRERDGAIEPLVTMDAEFGRPQWQFGASTYAFESADRLIACFVRDGGWTLARIDARSGRLEAIPTGFTDIAQLRAAPGRAVFIGGSPSEAPALVDLDLNAGTRRVLRRAFVVGEDLRRYVSIPEPIAFPTGGGETAHALYYPPFSPDSAAPAGETAPVLVKSHGGPTSAASSTLSLATQYWTSRGIGVLDVNYRGSTGYGRPYRLRLERQWGLVDVEDCIAGAGFLVASRNADPARLMITGGSAGGYTTLCALTREGDKTFSAGASHYGVSDLEALARDTHKFESRYLDWLIGPYPADKAIYADRSPINHADRLSAPVIFFQGSEDRVVPPNQTELMVAALEARGVPVGYFLFEGEQHGFRKADTIRRALDAELYFYAWLILRSGLRF